AGNTGVGSSQVLDDALFPFRILLATLQRKAWGKACIGSNRLQSLGDPLEWSQKIPGIQLHSRRQEQRVVTRRVLPDFLLPGQAGTETPRSVARLGTPATLEPALLATF